MEIKYTFDDIWDYCIGNTDEETKEKINKEAERNHNLRILIDEVKEDVKEYLKDKDDISSKLIRDNFIKRLKKTLGIPEAGEIWEINNTAQKVLIVTDLTEAETYTDYRVIPVSEYIWFARKHFPGSPGDLVTPKYVIHTNLAFNILRKHLSIYHDTLAKEVTKAALLSSLGLEVNNTESSIQIQESPGIENSMQNEYDEFIYAMKEQLSVYHSETLREIEEEAVKLIVNEKIKSKLDNIISHLSSSQEALSEFEKPEEKPLLAARDVFFDISNISEEDKVTLRSDGKIVINFYLKDEYITIHFYAKDKNLKSLDEILLLINGGKFHFKDIELKNSAYEMKLNFTREDVLELFNIFRLIVISKDVNIDKAYRIYPKENN
jgi:hypothetical protein